MMLRMKPSLTLQHFSSNRTICLLSLTQFYGTFCEKYKDKVNADTWPYNILLQGGRLYRYDFYRGLEHVMEDDLDEMYHAFIGINNLYCYVSVTVKWHFIFSRIFEDCIWANIFQANRDVSY